MKYLLNGIDMIISGIIMYVMYFFLPKNVWIISERLDQAQDNGIAFFKYLNKNHSEINSFYLLSRESSKIDKVRKIGNVLVQGTMRHKLLFLKSSVVASTEKNMIEPWGSRIFYKIFSPFFPRKIKVFLQHGILDKDVSSVYGKEVSNIDVFVTSTNAEKKFVEENFGYDANEIANVGISRYDSLPIDISKEKIILYMPTWRRNLFDLADTSSEYIKGARKKFIESNYYKEIQALINDKELIKILEDNRYRFIFIVHHGINLLSDLFTTTCNNIQIHKSEDINIALELSKCEIFITDYSSIHFDSAYIKNKNIYFQFDRKLFYEEHAGKSYFDYYKDGFGPVVEKKELLLQEIEQIVKNPKKEMDSIYEARRNRFFKYSDKNNCERLYNLISKKLKL